MEAAVQALLVEIIIAAVIGRRKISELAIGAHRTDKQRVLANTVKVLEGRILPGRKRWPSNTLPPSDVPRTASTEDVEVAGESLLAGTIDRDIVASLSPQSIVAQMNVWSSALDHDRIAKRLVHGIADDIHIETRIARIVDIDSL